MGEIWVVDARQGRSVHAVAGGELVLSTGEVVPVLAGRVDGFRFVVPKRGAPVTREMRDVAVSLALCLYLAGTKRDTAAQIEAQGKVVGLWAERGWAGVSENSHVRVCAKRGREFVMRRLEKPGIFAVRAFDGADGLGGAVVACQGGGPHDGAHIEIVPPYFFWQPHMEEAVFVREGASLKIPIERV